MITLDLFYASISLLETRIKGVHKNISLGYDKVKLHILKNFHFCYASQQSYQVLMISDFKEQGQKVVHKNIKLTFCDLQLPLRSYLNEIFVNA